MDATKMTRLERTTLAAVGGVLLVFLVGTVWLTGAGGHPAATAAAPAPTVPVPTAPPAPPPVRDDPRAEAVKLLGAAGSMRQAGELGVAVELARQAVAKAPDYAEAQQFLQDVELQKRLDEADAAHAAARNGWTKTASDNMAKFFWRQPNTSMLAAICAQDELERSISWAEYARRQKAGDESLDYLLGGILQRCRRTTAGLPLG